MQNAVQNSPKENDKSVEKNVEAGHATFGLTTGSTSPKSVMGKVQIMPSLPQNFKAELSGSDEEEVSEVESFMLEQDLEGSEAVLDPAQFLLTAENLDGPDIRSVDAETQERLEALLEAAGIGKLSAADGKAFTDPQVLRSLTSSVSCALDEAAAALKRMRAEQQGQNGQDGRSLAEACSDGDIGTVRRLLDEGGSVHETTEEGETLLSLACSAGYYELAQVLLAMRANVEDRGVKGDCTPLMEAASGGFKEIVDLLIAHGADVNAQSSAGRSRNTPLHYASCGGYEDVVRVLIKHGANVEEHNENGHTPLMEAASAGHVAVARILLENGAGINTHSNEFKESALTLACYKGHLEMVKFLLKAGADQEHKTDEMHTALMEASMDGHVEVARLLLDSGAQVNMPADSFESPLTLAACGGHVELASLLIERDAHLEEVNDEGYTPLMEAAREGHEEMVALLLAHGADINAQTEETQETALTLACCGGFLEVSDFLIKAGANIELGCSTPLMEAAQEGHLELVKYLLQAGAAVNAQTGTADTALTYACENGHTEVAEVLLKTGADLEHESEGGRTPLMKAARAGHLSTVQFLITKGACVNKQTSTNDHTVLSLASAGGHQLVVEMLLQNGANPTHRLKDGSTMLIEASKGGHTNVVNLLLDYHTSIIAPQAQDVNAAFLQTAANLSELPRVPIHGLNNVVPPHNANPLPLLPAANSAATPLAAQIGAPLAGQAGAPLAGQAGTPLAVYTPNIQPVPGIPQLAGGLVDFNLGSALVPGSVPGSVPPPCDVPCSPSSRSAPPSGIKANLAKKLAESGVGVPGGLAGLTGADLLDSALCADRDYPPDSGSPLAFDLNEQSDLKASEKLEAFINKMMKKAEMLNNTREEQMLRKQQILEELQKVERELKEKAHAQLLLNSLDQPFKPIQPEQAEQAELEGRMCELRLSERVSDGERAEVVAEPGTQDQAASRPGADGASDSEPDAEARTAGDGQDQPQPENPLHESVPDVPDRPDSPLGTPLHVSEHALSLPDHVLADHAFSEHVLSEHGLLPEHALQVPDLLDDSDDDLDLDEDEDEDEGDEEGDDEAEDDDDLDDDLDDELAGIHPQMSDYGLTEQEGLMLAAPALSLPESLQGDNYRASAAQNFLCQEMAQRHLLANFPQASLSGQFQHAAALSQFQPILGTQLPAASTTLSVSAAAALSAQYQQAAALTQSSQQLASSSTASQPSTFSTQQINFTIPQTNFVNLASTTANVLPTGAFNFQAQNINIQQLSVIGAQLGAPQPLSALPQTPLVSTQFTNTVTTSQTGLNILPGVPGQHNYFLQQPAAAAKPPPAAGSQKVEPRPRAPCQQTSSMLSQQMVQKKKKLKQKQLLQQQQQAQQQQAQAQAQLVSPGCAGQHQLPDSTSCQLTAASAAPAPAAYPVIDLDAETDSNHDTALTLACAGGHSELVQLLLTRGADIEHRDKKGFTPLILAATAGHAEVVEILLDNGADIEAQSERTKDTPLSLACSGGRYEVVEILLNRSASKEHRNVSDYTPLSLAASGGYVNIIKLLLSHGAEINSRTGSKLGISPLMLAAMNGHTAAVKLLLDMGSDINAQIETNRNTALTLACFQGRHEVVSLLVDRRANIEHRAKTGLTPLMEAASGGYVDVGRVLLDKNADVNAPPVPSSRDTALTIASDKGHYRFVELLISRGAAVDVKNKKGNSPLWLACNGGHLDVVQLLVNAGADIDSQDNRKVSCLMAAFRKGHVKVVKWMVRHVNQFPSDQECVRFIQTVTDKELLKKCQQCMDIIVSAKDRQAAEANKNASILLEELDMERSREESKKAALARKREKKKQKRKEKQEKEKEKEPQPSSKNSSPEPEKEDRPEKGELIEDVLEEEATCRLAGKRDLAPGHDVPSATTTSTMGTNLVNDANARNLRGSKRSASSDGKESSPALTSDSPVPENNNRGEGRKTKTKTRRKAEREAELQAHPQQQPKLVVESASHERVPSVAAPVLVAPAPAPSRPTRAPVTRPVSSAAPAPRQKPGPARTDRPGKEVKPEYESAPSHVSVPTKSPRDEAKTNQKVNTEKKNKLNTIECLDGGVTVSPAKAKSKASSVSSPVRAGGKKEDGWKEVTRKIPVPRYRKVSVPSSAITRVIGRNGCNINAIREVSGAHIEVDKQKKSGDRQVTIKGSAEAIKQAHNLITAMVKDPERDLVDILPKNTKAKSLSAAPPPPLAPIPIGVFTMPVTAPQQNGQVRQNGSPAAARPQGKTVVPTAPPVISAWTGPPAQGGKKSQPAPVTKPTPSNPPPPPAPAKSPSAVSRQLFPEKLAVTQAKVCSSSQPKTTITYTAASSLAKTHVTTSSSGKARTSFTPSAVSKPSPIFSQPPAQTKPSSAPAPTPPPHIQTTAGYSPFNNTFSNISEHVLGRAKDDQHEKMNFASVAAQGVVGAPPGIGPAAQEDPAKAPGYKPNSATIHKTRSPSPEPDLSKAPGYRGPHMAPLGQYSPHGGAPGGPGGPFPASVDAQHQILEALAQQQFQAGGMVLSLPAMDGEYQQFPQFRGSGQPSPHGLHDFNYQTEYSMPNQPMTLPKIESTLNPNAPNFMSRVYQSQLGNPFLANINSSLNREMASFVRAAQSSTPPSFTPPPQGNHAYPGNSFPPEYSNGPLGNFGSGFSAPGVNPANRPSNFSPLPHGPGPVGSAGPRGPPSAGSSSPNHKQASADTSPLPSSSPSPTDQLKSSQDSGRGHLRPIGTERAHAKKSPGPPGAPGGGYGGMGDAALWMFSAEMSGAREWLSEQQGLHMNGPDELRLGGAGYGLDGDTPVPGLTDPNFTSVGSSLPGSQGSQFGAYTNGGLPAGALNSLYGEAQTSGAGDQTTWPNNSQGWPSWTQQP